MLEIARIGREGDDGKRGKVGRDGVYKKERRWFKKGVAWDGVIDRGLPTERVALSDEQMAKIPDGDVLRVRVDKAMSRKKELAHMTELGRELKKRGGRAIVGFGPGHRLGATEKAFARLLAAGWSTKKAMDHVGIRSRALVAKLKKTPQWQWYYKEECDKFMEKLAQAAVENAPRARLGASAIKAIDRLDDVLDRKGEKSDTNAIKAADVMLKHALPDELKAGGGGGVIINISGEKESALAQLEAEAEGKLMEAEYREDGYGEEEGVECGGGVEVESWESGEAFGIANEGGIGSGGKPPRF
jgi:hypothetical protein